MQVGKDKKIVVQWYAEIIITILTLPYFLLTLITPYHIVEFLGAAIVTFALIRDLVYLWKIRGILKQEELPKTTANRFLIWYLIPVFVGMSLIYVSDLLTNKDYAVGMFAKDMAILIGLNAVAIFLEKAFKSDI